MTFKHFSIFLVCVCVYMCVSACGSAHIAKYNYDFPGLLPTVWAGSPSRGRLGENKGLFTGL